MIKTNHVREDRADRTDRKEAKGLRPQSLDL